MRAIFWLVLGLMVMFFSLMVFQYVGIFFIVGFLVSVFAGIILIREAREK